MPTGVVARFDCRRGYGFLVPDDGSEDVFVHQNNIDMEGFRYLKAGERVQFEIQAGEKGMKAIDVALLSPRDPDDQPMRNSYDDADDGYRRRSIPGDDGYRRNDDRPARRPRPDRDGAAERVSRKLERLISLLVAKGVLAPGEIDGHCDDVDTPSLVDHAQEPPAEPL